MVSTSKDRERIELKKFCGAEPAGIDRTGLRKMEGEGISAQVLGLGFSFFFVFCFFFLNSNATHQRQET